MKRASDKIPFSALNGLPSAPSKKCLSRIRYTTCPGSDLVLFLGRCLPDAPLDEKGVVRDGWWVVRCSGLPDRVMRLTRGAHSLCNLLRRYGFLDGKGCIHHREAVAEYEDADKFRPVYDVNAVVPLRLQSATGVPQFYPNSGICWFAALCHTSFSNPIVSQWLRSHMPNEMKEMGRRALFSRDDAEAFRKRLWYDFAVGDNVEDPPELDGRNGFSEFTVACAKLKVPLVRYQLDGNRMVSMSSDVTDRQRKRVHCPKVNRDDSHLLTLRYEDGSHHERFPIHRRITVDGRRYKLLGLYKGHRKCGHQIAACSHSGNWRDWSLGDADLHKDGIGPIFVRFDGPEWKKDDEWWKSWDELVHITKFGANYREMCNLNWHNRPDDDLDRFRGERVQRVGTLSIDAMYTFKLL